VRCLFENFKKFSKITDFKFQNSGPSFFASLSPVKKFDSIRTKLTEEIDFEICHSGNLLLIEWYALAGSGLQQQRAAAVDDRCADPEMLRPHHSTDPNWGHSEMGVQLGRKS